MGGGDRVPLSEPEQLRFDAGGIAFAALAWGPRDGPLALCLHGYPDTAWTWRHLGPHLAGRGWRVVAPFMRGYAPTGLAPDGGYQIGALASDAQALHAALGGDQRAALIGHDWGALATYCTAAHSPELFSRVVTMSIPPPAAVFAPPKSLRELAGRLPTLLRQAPLSWYIVFHQLPGVSERAQSRLIPKLWRDWSPGFDGTADVERALEALDSPARRHAALSYYRALLRRGYRRPAYRAQQKRWMAAPPRPLLYLHGENDGCFLPDFADRSRELLAPGSRIEIVKDAGHFLQLERPEIVSSLIEGFLSD